MKTYEVRLNIPTTLWATVEVAAGTPEEATQLAMASARDGQVSFEYTGFDVDDAEVVSVEDLEIAL